MDVEDDHEPEGAEELECREPTLEDLTRLCAWLNTEAARYVVVGGFAIRAAGYNRRTMDVDLLIETTPDNEKRVYDALSHLPDNAIRDAQIGDVQEYGVVRVADEYLVDLMKSGCSVTYADAIKDVVVETVGGVMIPFASPATLWRMKQTVREKDKPDKLFLLKWAEAHGVELDPPPQSTPVPTTLIRWLDRLKLWLEKSEARRG